MVSCPTVHAAFYLWYGTPDVDGRWLHWDHATLPHWDEAVRKRHAPPGQLHAPPEEPHSPYYPARGLYSSRDNATLHAQFASLAAAGVDTAMLSWWGRKDSDVRRDSQGVNTDLIVPAVLDAAAAHGVGISWHLEPYGGRSPATVRDDLKYLHERYGSHPAIWRQRAPRDLEEADAPEKKYVGSGVPGSTRASGRKLPLVFLYDVSFEHAGGLQAEREKTMAEWRALTAGVRDEAEDAILLSLYHDRRDVEFVRRAGFAGAYSYFGAVGFTEGSDPANWFAASSKLKKMGKLFVASVGPGYDDTRIRPWNADNRRDREGGKYMERMWRAALAVEPAAISITSYNEWGEGTQIEEARPHTAAGTGVVYADYGPNATDAYMQLTRRLVDETQAKCAAAKPRPPVLKPEL